MADKTPKPETNNTPETKKAEPFKLSDDQKEFFELAKATGQKFNLETDEGRHEFVVEANKWVVSGKPRPKFDKPKEEKTIPFKLFRAKVRGLQYFYFRDTNGELHGKHVEVKAEERRGAEGQKFTKNREIVHHTIAFDKKAAAEFVKQAQELCDSPRFYLVVGDVKYSVTAKDFLEGDFDELVMLHKQGKYIA